MLHLALLPKGFASIVLALAERFQWEATYRDSDYDFSDWDELQAIVDLGLAGLTDTVRLSDLLGYVDEVEGLLRALQNIQQVAQPCCPYVPQTPVPDAVDEETDPVPQVIQDNYGTGDDWGAVWENYMCPLLRQWFQQVDDTVFSPLEPLVNAGLVTMTLILGLYVSVMGIGSAIIVAGLSLSTLLFAWEQIVELIGEGALGDYSDWDNHADEFICAVRHADGPAGKRQAGIDWINSTDYSPLIKAIFWLLMDETFWKRAYSGIGENGTDIIVEGDGCPICIDAAEGVSGVLATMVDKGSMSGTGYPVIVIAEGLEYPPLIKVWNNGPATASFPRQQLVTNGYTVAYSYTPGLAGVTANTEVGEGDIYPTSDYEVRPGDTMRLALRNTDNDTFSGVNMLVELTKVYIMPSGEWVDVQAVEILGSGGGYGAVTVEGGNRLRFVQSTTIPGYGGDRIWADIRFFVGA